ncbi:MAG: hypothetical protein MJ214_00355 [Bacilli bacterium]|nr:hypothetical protein [Bacilli bacterium]
MNKSKGKMTLSKLAMAVNGLAEQMRDGFKRLDAKMDAGFKQVNTRLDYIVKANDLKDLSNSKNK